MGERNGELSILILFFIFYPSGIAFMNIVFMKCNFKANIKINIYVNRLSNATC